LGNRLGIEIVRMEVLGKDKVEIKVMCVRLRWLEIAWKSCERAGV